MCGKEIEVGGKKLVVTNEILRNPESKIYFIVKRLVKNFVFPIYNVSCKVGLCY
ncbi:hypothetical protein Calkr_0349 [Caldicellulosiruptor acetigenus I77R1B]|uniref:Uncharacterized protein n=2 Tax=Caldicellulosiruptor acetigenus TaxID=301953 RepID=G2PVH7_9FIRM|nr:hypothetical protein [Caldicellulosiruptor acetigenus]ADQ39908.1 hypothetical protein Calkr_0349 [Caldicellulosiruptor acetigenus I77R1B]AEM74577.1 hypothetical protein Calla_2009 [Caldicellulosiruptor acetigenus 6A]